MADTASTSSSSSSYDTIIIGCGMAGLAAGIRLAMYDKRVLILEKHNAPGGLNSFYFLGGRKCDVGLHAVTNYVDAGVKGTPLGKLLRQLRIPRESFALAPQKGSAIVFPESRLRFTNDFKLLESQVADLFPSEIDGFRALRTMVLQYDAFDLSAPIESARARIRQHIKNPLLEDMILCPLMYYGSAKEGDIDWDQFVIMWRALFEEGFARPLGGVRVIIRALLDRYREVGGERRMKAGVSRILKEGNRCVGVETEQGETILADTVISTVGRIETEILAAKAPDQVSLLRAGQLGYVETMSFFPEQPSSLGWDDTILFFNTAERFQYRAPQGAVDPCSGVICLPNNYAYGDGEELDEGILRVTALANPQTWKAFSKEDYAEQKTVWFERLQAVALGILPPLADPESWGNSISFSDMFTPNTVTKFTSHLNGAIYGTPEKLRSGQTETEGLVLAGTDQGFLGIIGAMLSGISMANAHVLQGGR